jgi:hypothetical protein
MQEKTREEISISTTRDGLTTNAARLERAKQSRDNNQAERHAKKPKNHGHMKLLRIVQLQKITATENRRSEQK